MEGIQIVKGKTIKLKQENVGEHLWKLKGGNDFKPTSH